MSYAILKINLEIKPPEDSWKIRKQEFLYHLATAPLEAKIITLADAYNKKGTSSILIFQYLFKCLEHCLSIT